ncbi:Farnesyl pyrophosphate synthase 1 [Glycine soja]|uniref:Farnesyl pyrophosphate synthase 1 n=1 Tax=Glycine soja TaxID=3848 RepID=A0A445F0P8_GLYSO|nr:Farnesyl pyrophosphate synthase 1 [Glycine soja]
MFHYASYFCQDVGKGEGSDDVGSDALDFEGLTPVDVRTAHDTGGVEDMSGLEREVPFWRRPELYWKGMSWARQRYKTAYFSFYLPVACALLMAGEDLDKNVDVKNILVEMGTYFQVQDCFGDPQTIGKIGTDIEDFKCSWLIVKAFELSNEQQKKVLQENYGKPDPENVAKVKALYNELNLQGVFEEYESGSYVKLVSSIEAHPSKAVQVVLKSFLAKIYKRQK